MKENLENEDLGCLWRNMFRIKENASLPQCTSFQHLIGPAHTPEHRSTQSRFDRLMTQGVKQKRRIQGDNDGQDVPTLCLRSRAFDTLVFWRFLGPASRLMTGDNETGVP